LNMIRAMDWKAFDIPRNDSSPFAVRWRVNVSHKRSHDDATSPRGSKWAPLAVARPPPRRESRTGVLILSDLLVDVLMA
jgi:hypothetical protein